MKNYLLAVLSLISALVTPATSAPPAPIDEIVGAFDVAVRQLPALATARKLPAPNVADLTLTQALAGSDLRLQFVYWDNNPYQTRQKFVVSWLFSKLLRGNAYSLKQRDARGVVTALYPLHPDRVTPLVAPDGSVYYQIQRDDLARVGAEIPAAPASEIIHDTMYCLFHPLVGVSPLFACSVAATQGLKIQQNGANFFGNAAMPSGVLTAPAQISDETAARVKREWEANYSGSKLGRVAVLGDGLKFEQMTMSALDAQLVQQAELSDRAICSAFHVPAFKVGVGPLPAHDNIEAFDQQYYSQCLQTLIESLETHLDEGLGLAREYRTEFDLDDLLRMDTARRN